MRMRYYLFMFHAWLSIDKIGKKCFGMSKVTIAKNHSTGETTFFFYPPPNCATINSHCIYEYVVCCLPLVFGDGWIVFLFLYLFSLPCSSSSIGTQATHSTFQWVEMPTNSHNEHHHAKYNTFRLFSRLFAENKYFTAICRKFPFIFQIRTWISNFIALPNLDLNHQLTHTMNENKIVAHFPGVIIVMFCIRLIGFFSIVEIVQSLFMCPSHA